MCCCCFVVIWKASAASIFVVDKVDVSLLIKQFPVLAVSGKSVYLSVIGGKLGPCCCHC